MPIDTKPDSIRAIFSKPPYSDLGQSHKLRKLAPAGTTAEDWKRSISPQLLADWRERLGTPSANKIIGLGKTRKITSCQHAEFSMTLYAQKTDNTTEQRILLLRPSSHDLTPHPCAIVPYYNVERPAGLKVANNNPERDDRLLLDETVPETTTFALHLVRQGFLVVCVEAYPFNTVPAPTQTQFEEDNFYQWRLAAQKLKRQHPDWTGLGRLVRDTSLALNLLLEQVDVDPGRVLAMGHSLGGKVAFFTGALDQRIAAVISSDFGLPWRSTNWEAPWYLGNRVPTNDHGPALHEVLALLAPRPFFLIAGETDTRESWQYIQSAQQIYTLLGADAKGMPGAIDHATGHSPTLASLDVAYAWIRAQFNLGPRSWRA